MSKVAVIQTGGKQYLVQENSQIKVGKLAGQTGDKIVFDQVLLVAEDKDPESLVLGSPVVENSKVEALIVDQTSTKTSVVRYKSKTRYRRRIGHRQDFTVVKVVAITN